MIGFDIFLLQGCQRKSNLLLPGQSQSSVKQARKLKMIFASLFPASSGKFSEPASKIGITICRNTEQVEAPGTKITLHEASSWAPLTRVADKLGPS